MCLQGEITSLGAKLHKKNQSLINFIRTSCDILASYDDVTSNAVTSYIGAGVSLSGGGELTPRRAYAKYPFEYTHTHTGRGRPCRWLAQRCPCSTKHTRIQAHMQHTSVLLNAFLFLWLTCAKYGASHAHIGGAHGNCLLKVM